MDATAPKTNPPASPLPRAFQRRPRLAALLAINSLLFLLPLALTSCSPPPSGSAPPILLFNGTGTSPNDVVAVEAILRGSHLDYAKVNSRQLNSMSESQLIASHLLIIPGGNFIKIADNLTSNTTATIHNAVRGGMNYLGICAGGFLAGQGSYNNLNLASSVRFGFYSIENQGIRKAAVSISSVGQPALEHYWEDGPQFTGWGDVVGKYPDGTPAIVEGNSGKGWVILSGVHPEAPANWRNGMTFNTSADTDNAYAATLIHAALNRTSLPHF